MSRRSRTAGVVLAASLTVAACGGAKEAAGRSLEQDDASARAALADSREAAFTVRLVDDPQGALVKAMTTGEDPLTAEQAKAVLGGQVVVRLDPNGDRTLRDYAATTGTTEQDLRANDTSFAIRSADGTLVEVRVADGDLYLGTDYSAVRKVAALGGDEATLDGMLASAPPELAPLVADLKAGKWVKVPLAGLLEQLDEAGVVPVPSATPDAAELLADLKAAIRPNVRLRDLGSKDGVREVTVEIDVKKGAAALLDVLRTQPGFPAAALPDAESLAGLSDRALTATLRIEDGHYTRLTVPLQGFVELDATPDPDAPALGGSAIVLDIDDSAEEISAPESVSSFDVAALLEPLLAGFAGMAGQQGFAGEAEVTTTG